MLNNFMYIVYQNISHNIPFMFGSRILHTGYIYYIVSKHIYCILLTQFADSQKKKGNHSPTIHYIVTNLHLIPDKNV